MTTCIHHVTLLLERMGDMEKDKMIRISEKTHEIAKKAAKKTKRKMKAVIEIAIVDYWERI